VHRKAFRISFVLMLTAIKTLDSAERRLITLIALLALSIGLELACNAFTAKGNPLSTIPLGSGASKPQLLDKQPNKHIQTTAAP
jgi:hypothetical protein